MPGYFDDMMKPSWQGAANQVVGAAPGWGGALVGAAYGGLTGGISDTMTGLNQKGMQLARRVGVNPKSVSTPKELSKGRQTGQNLGIVAANAIPYVGPLVSAGLSIAKTARQKRVQKQYGQQVKQAGQQNQNVVMQAVQRARQAHQQRQQSLAAGQGNGQQSREGASSFPLNPAGPNHPNADYTYGSGRAGNQARLSRESAGSNRGAGNVPQVGGGAPPPAANAGLPANSNSPARLSKRVYANLLKQGIPDSELSGMMNAATRAAQEARQGWDYNFGRTGDQSGYGLGIGTGLDYALRQQLAQAPFQFRDAQRNYLRDLALGWRARQLPQNPNEHSDVGGILSGIGQLGQAGLQLYSTGRQAGWWGQQSPSSPSSVQNRIQ